MLRAAGARAGVGADRRRRSGRRGGPRWRGRARRRCGANTPPNGSKGTLNSNSAPYPSPTASPPAASTAVEDAGGCPGQTGPLPPSSLFFVRSRARGGALRTAPAPWAAREPPSAREAAEAGGTAARETRGPLAHPPRAKDGAVSSFLFRLPRLRRARPCLLVHRWGALERRAGPGPAPERRARSHVGRAHKASCTGQRCRDLSTFGLRAGVGQVSDHYLPSFQDKLQVTPAPVGGSAVGRPGDGLQLHLPIYLPVFSIYLFYLAI